MFLIKHAIYISSLAGFSLSTDRFFGELFFTITDVSIIKSLFVKFSELKMICIYQNKRKGPKLLASYMYFRCFLINILFGIENNSGFNLSNRLVLN